MQAQVMSSPTTNASLLDLMSNPATHRSWLKLILWVWTTDTADHANRPDSQPHYRANRILRKLLYWPQVPGVYLLAIYSCQLLGPSLGASRAGYRIKLGEDWDTAEAPLWKGSSWLYRCLYKNAWSPLRTQVDGFDQGRPASPTTEPPHTSTSPARRDFSTAAWTSSTIRSTHGPICIAKDKHATNFKCVWSRWGIVMA